MMSPTLSGRSAGTSCMRPYGTSGLLVGADHRAQPLECRVGLAEPQPPVELRERPRGPPVEVTKKPHRRGDHQRTHKRRVDRDGDRHAEPYRLDDHDLREGEREEYADHDRGRAGDEPADAFQTLG